MPAPSGAFSSPRDKPLILGILRKHFPGCRVWIFGSRCRGDHRPFSDLDLCVDAGAPLDLARLGDVREALSASDLPYQVDLSDWHRITPDFRDHIAREGAVWMED